MANNTVSRFLLSKPKALTNFFSRTFSTASLIKSPSLTSSPSLLYRLRPLATITVAQRLVVPAVRALSSRAASSSLNDPNPNWSNRPPKETILLDGCDFEHWLVVMEKPEGEPTRDEIIDSYIKTLAEVVGSEEEARKKIYSVSTRCYFAFGALVSEELSYKIKELPRVRWVLPDSYLDVKNKDYGGEPFIDGKAVPYDPKYHEEWIRNNARANDRNRRNDRPRNNDRSRNFDRRIQNNNFQAREMPQHNQQGMPRGPPTGGVPPNRPPPNNMGGAGPLNNMGGVPPNNMGGVPPNNMGGMPQSNNMGGVPPNNMGGVPPNNMGGMPQSNNYGQRPPNQGWSGNAAPNFQNNPNQVVSGHYQNVPPNSPNQGGGMGYQGPPPPPNYQNNYPPHTPNQGGNAYQGGAPNYGNNYIPNRDGGNY